MDTFEDMRIDATLDWYSGLRKLFAHYTIQKLFKNDLEIGSKRSVRKIAHMWSLLTPIMHYVTLQINKNSKILSLEKKFC